MAEETRQTQAQAEAVLASLETRFFEIDPRKLVLLKVNAHYMRHETYQRLVNNIKRDGALTSTPLVWRIHDDDTQTPVTGDDGDFRYLVLSGNHRTRGSIDAELETITVQGIDGYLSHSRRRAIQLSHNAIFGEDDPAILKTIYESIDDVTMRMYSGLDDKHLNLIDQVSVVSLSEANLEFQTVSITFLPDERSHAEAVLDDARKSASGSKAHWLARWSEYDRYLDAIEATSTSHGVKNVATSLAIVLSIFERHITDLQEGFLDDEGNALNAKASVPIASILGNVFISAETASRLERVVQILMSRGDIDSSERGRALDALLDAFDQAEAQDG